MPPSARKEGHLFSGTPDDYAYAESPPRPSHRRRDTKLLGIRDSIRNTATGRHPYRQHFPFWFWRRQPYASGGTSGSEPQQPGDRWWYGRISWGEGARRRGG